MSNYYDYREVKVMIAHKLMAMDGWKVYGYSPDRSDSMTDYWDPAYWHGVAEKNGYVLCVDVYGEEQPQEIRQYNYSNFTYDRSIMEKISKLKAMTVNRGASEAEEASAKMMIERLQKKAEESAENSKKYIVTGIIPGHMAHPPKMNWHIEKDGIFIAKGNGILKYSKLWKYYNYSHDMEAVQDYKKDKEAYAKKYMENFLMHRYYTNEEEARKNTERHIQEMEEDIKLINQFESFINKIDTTCGGLLGEGDGTVYEKVTVTEYKKENKAVEDVSGSIKDGQLFILKINFNYGCRKGLVYRIHEYDYKGNKGYVAYKLNGKLTKECTGNASKNNHWYIGIGSHDNLTKWIEKGAISWCHIEEIKVPYEVEKVVKKVVKSAKTESKKETKVSDNRQEINDKTEENDRGKYTYEVSEDTDTRTDKKIYVVKVKEKLSREEYLKVKEYIGTLGGYYSRFKKGFIFKEDPSGKLNFSEGNTSKNDIENMQSTEENNAPKDAKNDETKEEIKPVSYEITEDKHTKTGQKIWIVRPEKELDKSDFVQVKRQLATLKGFYSSYVKGFIFKYDPTMILKTG